MTLYGATPSNTIYPTNIYTLEYDGWADFPQYPINVISDLNAFIGIAFVHGQYPSLNPLTLPPGYDLQTLPTSPGYTGVTKYNMITTPNGLPLLEPLRWIPGIGNPLADLLQPDVDDRQPGLRQPRLWLEHRAGGCADLFQAVPECQPAPRRPRSDHRSSSGGRRLHAQIHAETSASLSNVSHSLASLTATGGAPPGPRPCPR